MPQNPEQFSIKTPYVEARTLKTIFNKLINWLLILGIYNFYDSKKVATKMKTFIFSTYKILVKHYVNPDRKFHKPYLAFTSRGIGRCL